MDGDDLLREREKECEGLSLSSQGRRRIELQLRNERKKRASASQSGAALHDNEPGCRLRVLIEPWHGKWQPPGVDSRTASFATVSDNILGCEKISFAKKGGHSFLRPMRAARHVQTPGIAEGGTVLPSGVGSTQRRGRPVGVRRSGCPRAAYSVLAPQVAARRQSNLDRWNAALIMQAPPTMQ